VKSIKQFNNLSSVAVLLT